MSISLPPVIQAIQMDELKLPPPAHPKSPEFKAQLDLQVPLKKIIICTTRDIAKEDLAIFEGYGRVIEYDHDIHNNLPDQYIDGIDEVSYRTSWKIDNGIQRDGKRKIKS